MIKQFIEFKKERDFGLILGDTFTFLRNEFKPFIKILFSIAGPALIVLIIALAFYTYTAGDLAGFNILEPSFNMVSPVLFLLAFAFYLVAAIVSYVLSVSITLNYIKSYIDNKGSVNFKEVKTNTYNTFWSFLGLSILKGLTVFFAIMLCVLPVLYVMVPMAIVFSIFVFQPKITAGGAYSESFSLVNQDFWTAFGSFLVFVIIYYVLSMAFSLPTALYSIVKSGVSSGMFDAESMQNFTDPIYVLLNVLASFVQFFLNIILIVGGAFIYFHLNEKKNFTGTYEQISSIGENKKS